MESLEQILELVLLKLREKMNSTAYDAWIRGIKPLKMDDSTVYLQARTSFTVTQIEKK